MKTVALPHIPRPSRENRDTATHPGRRYALLPRITIQPTTQTSKRN